MHMLKKQLFLSVLAMLSFLHLGNASAALLSFDPSAPSVTENDTFDIDVVLTPEGGELIGAFSFNVDYDPLALTATDVQFSNALGDPLLFESIPLFDLTTAGVADISNVSLLFFDFELIPLQPVGGFTIATVSFMAIAQGMTSLGFSDLVIADDSGLPTNNASGGTAGIDISPIPLPGALWLMITGLLGIGVAARKRGAA
jgi:hypothetical protein